MRLKIISAFIGGAVVTAGLTVACMKYFEGRKKTPPVAAVQNEPPPASTPVPQQVRPAESQPHSTPVTMQPVATLKPSPKPSPMPREMARTQPPDYDKVSDPEPWVATNPSPTPTTPTPTAPAAVTPAPQVQTAQVETPQVQTTQAAPAVMQPAQLEPEPAANAPHSVVLQSGTELRVRIGETLATGRNRRGDHFLATLEQPLIIDGFIIAEKGARLEGEVAAADRAPRGSVNGVSHLGIRLVAIDTADRQRIPIRTLVFNKIGQSPSNRDAATIVATAAVGAAIGALAGGGKGAAIGAAAGGAAGTAGVLASHGPECTIPVETRLSFQIQDSVQIVERLQ